MNTAERVVEAYFRHCKQCFTATDIKVFRGQGRQLDLLATQPGTGTFFHVECSVSHVEKWNPHAFWLAKCAEFKFCGYAKPDPSQPFLPTPSDAPMQEAIFGTYDAFGIDRSRLQRVWCTWAVQDPENLERYQTEFQAKHGFVFSVLSFRDTVLQELENVVGTANYDDDVLRTLSLIKQRKDQTGN